MSTRIILCLDLDAFYASVEELLHPEWRGQPIIVGARPEERGVVSSCTYAARAFGVHSAMPMGRALQLCPHAIATPPRMDLYADYSHRVMAMVREYGCPMERVSVDEVFLDATECAASWGGALALAGEIKRRVHDETGLHCTVGIAANKLIAKIACVHGKPDGLIEVPAGGEVAFLAPLPISRLWGVGPKTTARLDALGLHTIGELQQTPLVRLKVEFGLWALELQNKARGLDVSLVETEREIKSISRETTFVKDVSDLGQLKRVLLSLSEQVGQDLRTEGLHAKTIAIKLRWPSFQTITRQTTLSQPTDSTSDIYQAAVTLLAAAVKRGTHVRLLGVRAANLTSGRQLGLFDTSSEKHARLDKAVDDLRERFGDKVIRRASLADKTRKQQRRRQPPHAG